MVLFHAQTAGYVINCIMSVRKVLTEKSCGPILKGKIIPVNINCKIYYPTIYTQRNRLFVLQCISLLTKQLSGL